SADQARLRGGPGADAARRTRRPRDGTADRSLLDRPGWDHSCAVRDRELRSGLLGRRRLAGGCAHLAGMARATVDDSRACHAALPLLPALPCLAVRGRRAGRIRLMLDQETDRKNIVLALWLLGLSLALLAGTVAVAFIYLAAD